MWNLIWIPILIPTLIIKSNCVVNKTNTDVYVHYGGHAEADYEESATLPAKTTEVITTVRTTTVNKYTKQPTTNLYEEATDNIVFIPNKNPPIRDEEDYNSQSLKIKDIMMMKNVNDATNKNFHVEKSIDAPNEDIVFITGKNHDPDKIQSKDNARRNYNNYDRIEGPEEDFIPKSKLNCSDLDCNNIIRSVCGVKFFNYEWRYRLFLNDCYFRKVNCGFKYEMNRYKQVAVDKCKSIGAHYIDRPYSFKLKPFNIEKQEQKPDFDARRSSSSRRSMTMNINGQFCSHPCPISCPDDYDPQCAVSGTGQRRVFINHCKLDHNSCFYSVVWHKRPLAECVGGKKADMRQNRGFIGWMQRVGIVDNKGRLVLE